MSRQLSPQQEIIAAQLTLNAQNALNSEVSQLSERALILQSHKESFLRGYQLRRLARRCLQAALLLWTCQSYSE
jgi:hypothetical protein